jgi:hypothetical protein
MDEDFEQSYLVRKEEEEEEPKIWEGERKLTNLIYI